MTQLLSHDEKIYESLNRNEEVDVIYLDFAKAFYKVDHKVERYGNGGHAPSWLREFFIGSKLSLLKDIGQRFKDLY